MANILSHKLDRIAKLGGYSLSLSHTNTGRTDRHPPPLGSRDEGADDGWEDDRGEEQKGGWRRKEKRRQDEDNHREERRGAGFLCKGINLSAWLILHLHSVLLDHQKTRAETISVN